MDFQRDSNAKISVSLETDQIIRDEEMYRNIIDQYKIEERRLFPVTSRYFGKGSFVELLSIVQTRYTVVCATADGHSVAKSLSKMILTFAVVAVRLLPYRDRKVKDMCKMKKRILGLRSI